MMLSKRLNSGAAAQRLRFLRWLFPFFVAGCATSDPTAPGILLFDGHGTSPNDVAAIERILRDSGLRYATASSARLNAISESELKTYQLLVIPGGNFEVIGNGLTTSTATKIRSAIGGGLGYLGICAGAFFAGASPFNGLNLTEGVRFPFYALENRGIRKAPVTLTTVPGATLEVYWEDGPQLAGWGEVVAKYPDGTAAVVQGSFGHGWVVLTGVHPEAPDSWRRGMAFTTPGSVSRAYAATLIDAALNRKPLPHD
jgi:glutamine amidotransferase-like uncharacterized protein